MADVFDPRWAEAGDRSEPDDATKAEGFSCGPLNREELNWLIWSIFGALNTIFGATIQGEQGLAGGGDLTEVRTLITNWSNLQPATMINGADLLNIRDVDAADELQRKITIDEFSTYLLSLIDVEPEFLIDPWTDAAVIGWQSAPPVSPVLGDHYAIKATATGDWTGQDDKVAYWNGTQWQFFGLKPGVLVQYLDSGVLKVLFRSPAALVEWIADTDRLGPVRRATAGEVIARTPVNAYVTPADLPAPPSAASSGATSDWDVDPECYYHVYISGYGIAGTWTITGLQGASWVALDNGPSRDGGSMETSALYTGGASPAHRPWVIPNGARDAATSFGDTGYKSPRGVNGGGPITKVRVTATVAFKANVVKKL